MENIFIVSEDQVNAAYRKAQELADTYKDWRWANVFLTHIMHSSQMSATGCVALMMTVFM